MLLSSTLSGFFSAGGGIVPEFSYLGTAQDLTDTNVYTFAAQSMGTADPLRYVVCVVSANIDTGWPFTSRVHIGGELATLLEEASESGTVITSVWIALVPAGTSGDVVVSFGTAVLLDCTISLYRTTKVNPKAYATATDVSGDPSSVTIDCPSNGIVVAGNCAKASSGTFTWAGLTERDDQLAGTSARTSAGDQFFSTQAALAVSADASGNSTQQSLAVVSLAPAASLLTAPAPEFSFLQSATSTSDLTTYTFSSQNLGAAALTRRIVCVITTDSVSLGNTIVSTCTIAGITAYKLVESTNANGALTSLWMAAVATGTTGDVVFTLSQGAQNAAVDLYRVTDINGMDNSAVDGTGDPSSVTIPQCAAGGVVIGGNVIDTVTGSATWTGITERADAALETSVHTSAGDQFLAGAFNLAVTCDHSGAGTIHTLSVATLRPRIAESGYLYDIIQDLGLTSNLTAVLDAADARSYDGSSQTWTDITGNGNDFFRGTTSGADATDPTFVGSIGDPSEFTAFSVDGGDYFTETAAHTFADDWHKNGGIFSIVAAVYRTSSNADVIFSNCALAGSGITLELTPSNTVKLSYATANGTVASITSVAVTLIDSWNYIGVSYDEANLTAWIKVNFNGAEFFTTSASTATDANPHPLRIMARGDTGALFGAGSLIGCIGLWSTAIGHRALGNIYAALKNRRFASVP